MQKLQGIFGPIPTFLNNEGFIDFDGNERSIKNLLETDIDGLFILGTTGEFPYFTMEEKKDYLNIVNTHLNQPKQIVCCVSHWTLKNAIELTEFALEKGFKCISASLPLYFPISEEGIYEYYRVLRKTIDNYDASIPFIFYHIPVFSATIDVKPEIIINLADEGVIQGVNTSTSDLEHCRQIIENTSEDFSFLCGTESLLIQGYRDGKINTEFDGGIFSGANIMPYTYKILFQATIMENRDEFARIWPLVDEFISLFDHGLTYLPQITKYAMKIVGYEIEDTVKSPLGVINNRIQKQTISIIRSIQSFWGSMRI